MIYLQCLAVIMFSLCWNKICGGDFFLLVPSFKRNIIDKRLQRRVPAGAMGGHPHQVSPGWSATGSCLCTDVWRWKQGSFLFAKDQRWKERLQDSGWKRGWKLSRDLQPRAGLRFCSVSQVWIHYPVTSTLPIRTGGRHGEPPVTPPAPTTHTHTHSVMIPSLF